MLRATILRNELQGFRSNSRLDSVTNFGETAGSSDKKARFAESKCKNFCEYRLHTLPSTTRLPGAKTKDGLVRVHSVSHRGSLAPEPGPTPAPTGRPTVFHHRVNYAPKRRSLEKKKSFIFGETDYLRE